MNPAYFEVGVVIGAFGFKGDIRVFPTTDDPERFRLLSEVYAETPAGLKMYAIDSLRYHKNIVILKLKGVDGEEAAAAMKGMALKIPPELALPLEDNQYYHRDLLDMRVFDTGGNELGQLVRILETGANDVYVISKTGGGELLIPAVRQFVLDVDVTARRMTVLAPRGL